MVCSMLTVAFLGAVSETYVRLPFATIHALGTCVAKGEEVVDSRREHWRSAWRAAEGAMCDIITAKVMEMVLWRNSEA